MQLGHHDDMAMLWCYFVGWDRAGDVDHQSEVAALDLKARACCATGCMLGMKVCGLMIIICIMAMCMPFILLVIWLHTW